MNSVAEKIYNIKKSKSYIAYNKYHNGNVFSITKISRLESMHSNFIAWLLDEKSSHGFVEHAQKMGYTIERV